MSITGALTTHQNSVTEATHRCDDKVGISNILLPEIRGLLSEFLNLRELIVLLRTCKSMEEVLGPLFASIVTKLGKQKALHLLLSLEDKSTEAKQSSVHEGELVSDEQEKALDLALEEISKEKGLVKSSRILLEGLKDTIADEIIVQDTTKLSADFRQFILGCFLFNPVITKPEVTQGNQAQVERSLHLMDYLFEEAAVRNLALFGYLYQIFPVLPVRVASRNALQKLLQIHTNPDRTPEDLASDEITLSMILNSPAGKVLPSVTLHHAISEENIIQIKCLVNPSFKKNIDHGISWHGISPNLTTPVFINT